jgi:hypothetical protein
MKLKMIAITLLVAGGSFLAIGANAANVTPDVIMGSGIANGDFTVGSSNNVEIGLRAKQRFPPANIFNYDGVNTYNFQAGSAPGDPDRPLWNFEWSINSDLDGQSGRALNQLSYLLRLDTDPGAGTSFFEFDPVNVPYADNAIGDNNTGNGGGAVAPFLNVPAYQDLIANNNVAQNSWSMSFFPALLFDPDVAGLYTIELFAMGQDGKLLAGTGINVEVSAIPLPAALPLYGAGLAVLGFLGWRKRKMAAAA